MLAAGLSLSGPSLFNWAICDAISFPRSCKSFHLADRRRSAPILRAANTARKAARTGIARKMIHHIPATRMNWRSSALVHRRPPHLKGAKSMLASGCCKRNFRRPFLNEPPSDSHRSSANLATLSSCTLTTSRWRRLRPAADDSPCSLKYRVRGVLMTAPICGLIRRWGILAFGGAP